MDIKEAIRKSREQQTTAGSFVSGDTQKGNVHEETPKTQSPQPSVEPEDDNDK